MRFSELLDRVANPAGTLIKRSFRWAGFGDVDEIVERSPREFLDKLAELFDGDDKQAKLFVYLLAEVLEVEHGVITSGEEWLEAFETDDAAYVRSWLEKLDSLLK